MSIFDLLLILLVLASAGAFLVTLIVLAMRRWVTAGKLLAGVAAIWIVYLGVGTAVAVFTPQRTIPIGEDRCFDEMCFAVTGFHRSPAIQTGEVVTRACGEFLIVSVRVSNRSHRRAQREAGRMAVIVDEAGHRYQVDPRGMRALSDGQGPLPGLDATVDAGESVEAKLVFDLPLNAPHPAFVLGSNLAVNPASIVIADDAHFLHKPSIIPLD